MKNSKTILIVDDEPYARDVMEGFLAREGYDLAFAATGHEALDYLSEQTPDVILLDVMMPDMSGFEVCQQVKEDERWKHVPIIMVTALSTKSDLVRSLEAGADDFLNKPVNALELRARVYSMLRIKSQYDELQRTLHLRDDLARMIVHDMRSPLNSITGLSELLLMDESLAPEVSKDINTIQSEANRLNSFLDDMLIIAKMEAGQPILNLSMVDVNLLIQKVEESHRILARSRSIKLIIDLPLESRQLPLDVNLFRRMLGNLLTNAIKFSPSESTITMQVEYLEPESVSVTNGSGIRIRVLDEGPGIAKEHRDRIFEKYEIVDLKQSGVPQIGLGLAFCKLVVEAHGGHIFVADNEPVGSIFTIEF